MSENTLERVLSVDKKKFVPEDRMTIGQWQDRAIELSEQDNFRNHPVTRRLVEIVKQEVERIENILKNDENLTEIERKSLFKEKKTHLFYLDLFTFDGSSELEAIDHKLDEIIYQ